MGLVARGVAKPAAALATSTVPVGIAVPTQPVTESTSFAPEASYRVRLSAEAAYLGTPLSPLHLHVVTGTVAQAIRDKILAYAAL